MQKLSLNMQSSKDMAVVPSGSKTNVERLVEEMADKTSALLLSLV